MENNKNKYEIILKLKELAKEMVNAETNADISILATKTMQLIYSYSELKIKYEEYLDTYEEIKKTEQYKKEKNDYDSLVNKILDFINKHRSCSKYLTFQYKEIDYDFSYLSSIFMREIEYQDRNKDKTTGEIIKEIMIDFNIFDYSCFNLFYDIVRSYNIVEFASGNNKREISKIYNKFENLIGNLNGTFPYDFYYFKVKSFYYQVDEAYKNERDIRNLFLKFATLNVINTLGDIINKIDEKSSLVEEVVKIDTNNKFEKLGLSEKHIRFMQLYDKEPEATFKKVAKMMNVSESEIKIYSRDIRNNPYISENKIDRAIAKAKSMHLF